MSKINRVVWASLSLPLAAVPLIAAAPRAASADTFVPWRHVDRAGRVLEEMCPAERSRGGARCYGKRIVAGAQHAAMPKGLGGDQVADAYGVPAAAKSGGAIVAIVDAGGDSSALNDLQAYRAHFGLGAIDACPGAVPVAGGAPCLAVVDQTGGTALPKNDPDWATETSLDLDMVSAACPDCSILLVEASTQGDGDLGAAVDYAASVPGVVAVSNSYGWPEGGDGTPFSTADTTHYDHPGVAILAASGDQDYLGQGYGGTAPSFPASAPTVIGVGGTRLSPSTGGTGGTGGVGGAGGARRWTETVWNAGETAGGAEGAGSGCSTHFARPAWQKGIATGSCSSTMRASVDVSAAADYEDADGGGGILVVCGAGCGGRGERGERGESGGGSSAGFVQVVGTSAATPIVAGILARLGVAKTVGADPGVLYRHPSGFFDVADGSNNDPSGRCHDVMCTASPGWDGPTGLGTPNAATLAGIGVASASEQTP